MKLKPCPFCGRMPAVTECGERNRGEIVECLTIECVGPSVHYYGKNVARKKWNKRAQLPRPGADEKA